ncbi:hypothetical protein CCC_03193 [Paramagnetospirillum magnetotacticum MS-1]|uniref:Uncharacterized protein n=1 Tax=Paramagnetospirillum magnetotacticum MS-1 TaxID=272627 RepID=A0A0C2Z138_PARME|nr:hypothetical protein CCC_03193 [Paramagnetospirillum magnetotacticum MS-1]
MIRPPGLETASAGFTTKARRYEGRRRILRGPLRLRAFVVTSAPVDTGKPQRLGVALTAEEAERSNRRNRP